MYLNFAWRYFKAKKSTNAINIISWVSVTAIIIGTASLIIILSAFNGFESLVKSLYSSFYTDLRVKPAKGKILTLTKDQLQKLAQFPGVKAVSLIAEEKALLQNGEFQAIVFIKGVDSNYAAVAGVARKNDPGNIYGWYCRKSPGYLRRRHRKCHWGAVRQEPDCPFRFTFPVREL